MCIRGWWNLSRHFRLWLNCVSWGQALLKQVFWHISRWLPFQKHREFFSSTLWESGSTPGDETHKSVETSWWLHPPLSGIFVSQTCPRSASSNLPITAPLSLHWHCSCAGFCSWLSSPVSCDLFHISVSLSGLRGSSLPYNFTYLTDLRIFGFLVWSVYWWTEWSLPSFLHAGLETLFLF